MLSLDKFDSLIMVKNFIKKNKFDNQKNVYKMNVFAT